MGADCLSPTDHGDGEEGAVPMPVSMMTRGKS